MVKQKATERMRPLQKLEPSKDSKTSGETVERGHLGGANQNGHARL